MNKARRTQIAGAIELLEQAKNILEEACSEEQEYKDNMPESFQQGDKGQKADEAISNLENADYLMDDVVDSLNSLVANIDEVVGYADVAQE